MKYFARFLVAMLFGSVPLALLVLCFHHANKPDLRPVSMPPPLVGQALPPLEPSPYNRHIEAEKRAAKQLQAEYARGYKEGVKARP